MYVMQTHPPWIYGISQQLAIRRHDNLSILDELSSELFSQPTVLIAKSGSRITFVCVLWALSSRGGFAHFNSSRVGTGRYWVPGKCGCAESGNGSCRVTGFWTS